MATATDLDGFLRNDDDNLTIRLVNWLGSGEVKGHTFAVNVRFRPSQGTSFERLTPEPISGRADPNGAGNMVEQIERAIVERLGPSPFGTLRVQGYTQGKSAAPSLDMQRTLIPPESGGLGEPNVNLLRALLSEERSKNAMLTNALVQQHGQTGVMAGQLALGLQQAATVRTATTASSDLAGLPTVLALGVLLVFMPSIKVALGLPSDAPMRDVIAAAQRYAIGAVAEARGERPGLPSPAEAAQLAQADRDRVRLQIPAGARNTGNQAPGVTGDVDGYTSTGAEPEREPEAGPARPSAVRSSSGALVELPEAPAERARAILDWLQAEIDGSPAVFAALAAEVRARPELLARLALA